MTHSNEDGLRREVRQWLAENSPVGWREAMTGASQEAFVAMQRDWLAKLVAAGYATPHWDHEWPGGGRSLSEQKVIFEEIARADAPRLFLYFISLYHAASTLLEWGTPEQKQHYLSAILRGDIWCQGFSEPNAGSDLAAVATRAELVGDHYVINGQKIWSTMAQFADHCLLLVRTAANEPTAKALTYLLMDMKSPGITVRPIPQITGDDEFAEVFLDDVRIPVSQRMGAEGQGWAVAQSTLASERGLTLIELAQRMRSSLWRVTDTIRSTGLAEDGVVQADLGRLAAQITALCALADGYLARRVSGEEVAGDASIVKLYYAQVLRDFTRLGQKAAGLEGQYLEDFTRGGSQETGNWPVDFMNSFAWSIAGGSNEIQRNIVSERLLEMPREPREWKLARGQA